MKGLRIANQTEQNTGTDESKLSAPKTIYTLLSGYSPVSPIYTVTTTNNTTTNIHTFTPSNGVVLVTAFFSAIETATGDALGITVFAVFKVIAGVVTQVSSQTSDRKSNFGGSVTAILDTNGTIIRARVTGKTGSNIDWKFSYKTN